MAHTLFEGQSLRVVALDEGLVELVFDRQGDAINKFDARTVDELRAATGAMATAPGVRGVLVSSAKDVFIVGADITEFGASFRLPEAEIAANGARSNAVFNAFEDLGVPTVVALNGFALGGGFEMALAATYRVMSDRAQVGLPEVKLGLFPGFGGTVRLPRVAGAATAIDWIASGAAQGAQAALRAQAVDDVAPHAELRTAALAWLRRAAAGELDWPAVQQRKREPVALPADEAAALFSAARERVARQSPRHQPAAVAAVELMQRAAPLDRAGALQAEHEAFARITQTQAARSLIQAFLSEQALKKLIKPYAQAARPVRQAAVLGAGIMGGGLAATHALKGVPVRLKDMAQAPLDLGLAACDTLLAKRVKAGRCTPAEAEAVRARIAPQLDLAGFDEVDLAIEAVVENLAVKHRVMAELEAALRPDAVIATNTSSLRVDDIARPLQRPENVVGLHFFNPVPVMPLVEVVRGSRTSDAALATAVAHARALGKTPIVVRDAPGFLVNRILTAYCRGFLQLLADGADFEQVDRAAEAFGWPMGPAWLEDVVGLDTGSHVVDVISAGYPTRMPPLADDALKLMVRLGRLGQKNGIGFYRYEADAQGRPRRQAAPDTHALLATLQPRGPQRFDDETIVERLMLPLIIEAAHALEDGVVATPMELDQALLMGIGLPAYLGGALAYADWLGLPEVLRRAERHAALGAAYHPTPRMREMAAQGQTYYTAT